jgi:tetratricopeptide (TPR) repeat protein
VAGVLFGLHPAHVENVAWLSAVGDLLLSTLCLTSFLAFLQYRERRGRLWLGISLSLFALALLAKETAMVFPALILTFALLFEAKDFNGAPRFRERLSRGVRESIAYFSILPAYLLVRSHATRGLSFQMTPLPWTTMVLTWPSVLWFDVRHLVFPVDSSEFYSLPYVTAPTFRLFFLPVLLLGGVVVMAALWIRRCESRRVAQFAWAWVVLTLLPTLYLRAIKNDDIVHDRYLYLPSVGLVILVALGIRQWAGRWRDQVHPALPWLVVFLLAAVCAVGTVGHQLQWASDLLLYQQGLRFAPNNEDVKDNLANELVAKGEFNRAIALYLEVLQRNPRFWRSNCNLAYVCYRMGNYRAAEDYLQRAIQIDDRDAAQFIYLAMAQLQQGKLVEATRSAERAIGKDPSSLGYHLVLGKILAARGDRTQAMAEFKVELVNHPENAGARRELELQR